MPTDTQYGIPTSSCPDLLCIRHLGTFFVYRGFVQDLRAGIKITNEKMKDGDFSCTVLSSATTKDTSQVNCMKKIGNINPTNFVYFAKPLKLL